MPLLIAPRSFRVFVADWRFAMWLDEGIGPCTRCATERRLFSADGASALCSVCTLDDDRTAKAQALRALPDPGDPMEHGESSDPAPEKPRSAIAEQQRQRRLRLEAGGFCNICGKEPPRPRKKTGEKCARKYYGWMGPTRKAIREKAYREERLASGVCIECGGRREPDGVRCSLCQELNRVRKRERYAQDRERGVCVDCHEGAPESGGVRCAPCLVVYRKRRPSKGYMQSYRRQRFDAGVCHDCPYPRLENARRCAVCAQRKRELMATKKKAA